MKPVVAQPTQDAISSTIPVKTSTSRINPFRQIISKFIFRLLSIICGILVIVDFAGNNWEFNNFVGNVKYLFGPLLSIRSIEELETTYYFPSHAKPSNSSKIGRFMLENTIRQIHDMDGNYYRLMMGEFAIENAENDICGQLVDVYPVDVPVFAHINLGNSLDQITFARGNSVTHIFGDTAKPPFAVLGDKEDKLRALGYGPIRIDLDTRTTTPIIIPPDGDLHVLNITMHRFHSKAFCSGCQSVTELGYDTCTIKYSFNDTANKLTVFSSKAIQGGTHITGMIFIRRWVAMLSLYIRGLCLLVAVGAYTASQKTVQWTDPTNLTSWYKKLMHMIAPPQYRHVSHAFHFLYFCFNSDLFVFFYSLSVAADENVSMVYARVMRRWSKPSSFDLWIELQMAALSFRWLWFNLALLKALKWFCHFMSTARYTGANFVMRYLNFSSIWWVYLTVLVFVERTDYIEYGCSIRVDLNGNVQDLNSIQLDFWSSWYVRILPSLLVLMLCNLFIVLLVNHVVNRRWWMLMLKNSLARQHMFNSTSILTDMELPLEEGPNQTIIKIKARATCTVLWFFTSHLTCFGLPEDPSLVRRMASSKVAKVKSSSKNSTNQKSAKPGTDGSSDHGGPKADEIQDPTAVEMHIIAQDQSGFVHLYDSDKREVQALGVEVKILRDSMYHVG